MRLVRCAMAARIGNSEGDQASGSRWQTSLGPWHQDASLPCVPKLRGRVENLGRTARSGGAGAVVHLIEDKEQRIKALQEALATR